MVERDVWSFYEPLGGGDRTGLAVLSEAMAKLGQVYPSTVAERETVLTDAVSAAFEAFDERYFLLEASTNADELLSAALAGGT